MNTRRPTCTVRARPVALAFATVVAGLLAAVPTAAAQGAGGRGGSLWAPEYEGLPSRVRFDPWTPATSESVAAVRTALEEAEAEGRLLEGTRVTVQDPGPLSPVTVHLEGPARALEAVKRALQGRPHDVIRVKIDMISPGRSGETKRGGILDQARKANFIDAIYRRKNEPPPRLPLELRMFLTYPVCDRAGAAVAAAAAVPPDLETQLIQPAPADRALTVRYVGLHDDDGRIVEKFMEAGFSVDATAHRMSRRVGRGGKKPWSPYIYDHAAERNALPPAGPTPECDAVPRLLTMSYDPTPDQRPLPEATAAVRAAVVGAVGPGAELVLADWPGRTLLIRYTGTAPAGWGIATAVAAAVPPPAQDYNPEFYPGFELGRDGFTAEFERLADSARFEPPGRTAWRTRYTLRTPVPGDPARNTPFAQRLAEAMLDPGAEVVEADWPAGELAVRYTGYPWGGDRFADALEAAQAVVLKQETVPAGD